MDGPLSYDAYLDAIRRGRTAVAGKKHNRMDMRVDGARLGSEITLAEPSDLTIDIDSELEEAATAQISSTASQSASSPCRQDPTSKERRSARSGVRYVDHLRGLAAAQTRPEARLYLGTELDATLARYDAARAELMTRFRESGGIDCP